MGIKERKEREKEQRRMNILDTAQHLFFLHGFENTSMEQVAKASELSKGTLYLYYSNKEDLFYSVIVRSEKKLLSYLLPVADLKLNGADMVSKMGEAYIQFAITHADHFKFMSNNGPIALPEGECICESHKEVHQCAKVGLGLLISSIQKGIDDGSLRNDLNPETLSVQLWATLRGLLQVQINEIEKLSHIFPFDLDNIVPSFMEIINRGIRT